MQRRLPAIDIIRLRDLGMQAVPDSEVLTWAAEAGRVVLSHDARTMPRHARERLDRDLPLAGLLVVPQRLGTGAAIDDLELLATAGVKADFQDRILYLPLGGSRPSR